MGRRSKNAASVFSHSTVSYRTGSGVLGPLMPAEHPLLSISAAPVCCDWGPQKGRSSSALFLRLVELFFSKSGLCKKKWDVSLHTGKHLWPWHKSQQLSCSDPCVDLLLRLLISSEDSHWGWRAAPDCRLLLSPSDASACWICIIEAPSEGTCPSNGLPSCYS